MTCPKCKTQLPDGAVFCNSCGYALPVYDPPEGFELDSESGRYYRNDHTDGNTQWVTWFDANSGEYEQTSYPVQNQPESIPSPKTVQYPIPEGFKLNAQDGLYYIGTPGKSSENGIHGTWSTSFNPRTGEYNQQFIPSNPGAGAENYGRIPPHPQPRQKKSNLVMLLPVIVLMIGFGAAFLHSGGFSASQNSSSLDNIELLDLANAPALVLHPFGSISTGQQGQQNPADGTKEPSDQNTPEGQWQPDAAQVEQTEQPVQTETPHGSVTLNMDLLGLIGQNNARLKEVNGDHCVAYFMGGTMPVADYMEMAVRYEVVFFLDGDFDIAVRLLNEASGFVMSHVGNIWSNDFIISGIEVSDTPYFSSLPILFQSNEPLTLDNMTNSFDVNGDVQYIPEREQELDYYGFDIWQCELNSGGYRIIASFNEVNGVKKLFTAWVMKK